MSEVDPKAEIPRKLVKFIARSMNNLTVEQWKALSVEEKKKLNDQSRSLLKAERNFLKKLEAGESQEDDDD